MPLNSLELLGTSFLQRFIIDSGIFSLAVSRGQSLERKQDFGERWG
jgi:hypothetical protein